MSQDQADWTSGRADIGMSGGTGDAERLFYSGVPRMVLYTVKQDTGGLWSIRRKGLVLFSDLKLAAAIELARSVARDEHERSNRAISVEFRDVSSVIRVGNFAQAPARERITTW